MSHFAVMVIGDYPDEQLAPFEENGNGDIPIEYLSFYNVETETKPIWDNNERLNSAGSKVQDRFQTYDEFMTDYYGYEFNKAENAYGYMTNNNGKWDWKVIGGRFRGYFKLKLDTSGVIGRAGVGNNNPKYDADQALKKDIDFDGMIEDYGEEAAKDYDLVKKLFSGTIPTLEYHWLDLLNNPKYEKLSYDAKRNMYNAQPGVLAYEKIHTTKKFKKLSDDQQKSFQWGRLDSYQISKEEYIQKAREVAISPFAILKDGVWYEKDSMGWFSEASGDAENIDWNADVRAIIDASDDNELFSVYDLHC